ncbi:hypothetical protein JAAARDRAFT_34159 [Jaapia argillacea MUCL 33604]|uniref:Uncharacterized protein n=1 Tax=Jaapia argillacea MUCL 33604 TaxID=933084 RepID=A0A067PUC4_9AGAM|nr:hypothetical protein JAAARDRAFT_34159 [Jaapia argillacea MUCL 33604]
MNPGDSMSALFALEPRDRTREIRDWEMPPRIPAPRHRHAAPCGPWPWMDLRSDFFQLAEPSQSHTVDSSWRGYPQNLFPNWTPDQARRGKITGQHGPPVTGTSSVYKCDVMPDGTFTAYEEYSVTDEDESFWKAMNGERPPMRVRTLFVDNMTHPVLQMLGTTFNVEPFFFTSSLNWIPSRYQEEVQPGKGDHITVTLTFIRTIQNPLTAPSTPRNSSETLGWRGKQPDPVILDNQVIDTQSPLSLSSTGNILLLDLLALHLVRTPESSTIISYHPESTWQTTSAKRLNSLVHGVSQSVYWQKIFEKSSDPTFVMLAILWYACYAWDEALEVLYGHINWMESRVISTNDMDLVRELHIIQAHLLHYASLLNDFQKSVTFVLETKNPAMDRKSYDPHAREVSRELMKTECNNLLSEIDRLERSRLMQSMRLKNVMDLAFATVNIEDSKDMRKLTEATVRDSAAMKQISYLTMIFLPASFAAGIFGMNVKEINPGTNGTMDHYVEASLVLTVLTVWIIVALQRSSPFHEPGQENNLWVRLCWPVLYLRRRWPVSRGHTVVNKNPA